MLESDVHSNETEVHDLYLNIPQMRCILADPKELFAHMGRRLGKSTEIIAHLTSNRVHDMPRAAFLLMGRTYKQVLTRTLPGTVHGWEKRGFYEDVHYVIGRKPPPEWPKAFGAPVKDYKHYISWYTGTGFHIGSQDRPGLVNSLTVWGIFADESKLLLEERFKEDAMPTNSGPKHYFKDSPHNQTLVLTSSMPSLPDGKWLLEMEKRMNPKQIEEIIKLAIYLEEAKADYNDPKNEYFRPRILKKISTLQHLLNLKRQNSVMYIEASTIANIHVLGADYIRNQRNILKKFFVPEILSLRPESTEGGFYANLTKKNFYVDFDYSYYDKFNHRKVSESAMGDRDCVKSQPLIMGMDFGAKFNCIVTAQRFDSINTIKFIKNHYVGSPRIVDDVVNDWCDYYQHHPRKQVEFHHDKTGNNKTGLDRETYAERVMRILRHRGWEVNQHTMGGSNPRHLKKYLLWNLSFPGKDMRFPIVQINQENCAQLKVSMENSLVKEREGVLSKDKRIEQKDAIPPEDATHLSDAADTIMLGEYEHLLTDDDLSIAHIGVR